MARYGLEQLLRQNSGGFPDRKSGRTKFGQHINPAIPQPYEAGPKYDVEAALAEMGDRPTMPVIDRAPRGGAKDILPMVLAGIADALSVKAGRQTDNVGKVRQLGEYYRDQDYQDRLATAAREFEGKRDQFGWNLTKVQMRKGAADRQEDVGRAMNIRREDIIRGEKDKAYARTTDSQRRREDI